MRCDKHGWQGAYANDCPDCQKERTEARDARSPRFHCPQAPTQPFLCVRGLATHECMYCARELPLSYPTAISSLTARLGAERWQRFDPRLPMYDATGAQLATEAAAQLAIGAAAAARLAARDPSPFVPSEENRAAVRVLQQPTRQQVHPPVEPVDGWQNGFLRLLLDGRCPWCAHPMQNISVDAEHGVRWSCFEGCNP